MLKTNLSIQRFNSVHKYLIALALLLASAALYGPWVNNPLIFDDIPLIKNPKLYEFAQHPLSLLPRQFPYFTLGFEHVVSGGESQLSRYVTLVLHAVNGFLLYLLASTLLQRCVTKEKATGIAFLVAVSFVLSPVAVYCVAYLVQRTIVFATLFLLLSALQFDRALNERSWRRATFAGLFLVLSVMSKEHALTGVVSVAALVFLQERPLKKHFRTLACYLATAGPALIWVAGLKLGMVGVAYEPDVTAVMSSAGFPDVGSSFELWLLSAALQCAYFFRYLLSWCIPISSNMSIDVRPDIKALATFPYVLLGALGFVAVCVACYRVFLSNTITPALRLVSYGFVWFLGLFLIELSTVRFQEPFVLYRSYLWAPGMLLAVAGVISMLPGRLLVVLGVVAVVGSASLAWERLHTFSDELLLWEEAAVQLPNDGVTGAPRVYYNRGNFRRVAGQREAALQDFEKVIQLDPNGYAGYWGRGALRLDQKDHKGALADLNKVVAVNPNFGMAHFYLGMLHQTLGDMTASQLAFDRAEELGIPRLNILAETKK